MKRPAFLSAAALALSMSLMSGAASAAETLRLASWGASKHYISQTRLDWIKEVNDTAGGEVEIVDYPGGQLFGPKEMHTVVAKGSIDLGVVLNSRAVSMVPMLEGAYLPFAFDSVDDVARAYSGESRQLIEQALEKKGLKLIFATYVGGVQLYSARGPVEKVEDLEGLRVLLTSPMLTEILSRLGASPGTSIPQTEQYMALKRGVADGMLNGIVSGYFQKTFEVAPHMTQMNMSFPTLLMTMNLKKWNRLPEQVQTVMLEAGRRQEAASLEASKQWDAKFLAELEKVGGRVTRLPEAERARIREVSQAIWETWAEENGPEAKRLLALNLGD